MELFALILAFALVFLNGFFVATEFAIVKVRPTRIEELLRQKKPGSRAAQPLIADLDAHLSATQLGITLASLGLGWIGEPAFAHFIEGPLHLLGITNPTWVHNISVTSAFGLITLLHIVVGELAPKSMALINAEKVALVVAYPMRLFYLAFFPLIWFLNGVSNALLRSLGLTIPEPGHTDGHSEEELKIILRQARSAGLLSEQREQLIRKALVLSTKTARHLMVPRSEVEFLDINLSLEENIARAMETNHKRYPLCDRELDEILGIIDVRDLVLIAGQDKPVSLQAIAKNISYFPEMMSGERLLTEFQARKTGMAVIVDEYGGTSGVLTAADVVSAVMGELEEADDQDMVQLPGGAYDVEGVVPIEEIEETLKISLEYDEDMRTIAGYLMEKLGRMPRVGDRLSESNYTFLVLDISGPRVNKIRIQQESRDLRQRPRPTPPPSGTPPHTGTPPQKP